MLSLAQGGAVPKHLSRLIDILAQISGANPSEIKPQTKLTRNLGLDSLDFTEIEHEIAVDFGVDINISRHGNDTTVQDILDVLSEKLEW
jgi:acyl carrier protein